MGTRLNRLAMAVLKSTHNLCFEQKYEKYQSFLSENFQFLEVKFSVYSRLVISNSKGLSAILRDIHTSTYQICRIEEKLIRLTTFNKYMCNWTLAVRDILKILWKRGEIRAKF